MLYFTGSDGKERKVFFKHTREVIPANPKKAHSKAHKRPRHTFCSIAVDEKVVGTGQSSCCPLDHFSYGAGRKRAFCRALQNSGMSREDRTAAWKAYHAVNK